MREAHFEYTTRNNYNMQNNDNPSGPGKEQDALYSACQSLMQWNAKYPSKAYTDYKIAVAADKELAVIIQSIGIAMNIRESYAASRQQGYSLERVSEIAAKYFTFAARTLWNECGVDKATFNEWSKTPEGKALLSERSMPVGAQTATDILKEAWVNANPGADISIFEENVKEDDEVQFVLAAMDNYLAALGRSPWVVYNGDNSSRKTLPFPGKTVYIKYQSFAGLWEREIGDRNHIINLYENGWQEIYWFADESAAP